jgi:hypothetical protein
MPAVREVERVGALDPTEFVSRFDTLNIPVVLEGAVRDSQAVRRFSREYLTDKLGHVEIPYKLSSCHKHPDFGQDTLARMFARGRSTFGEFLEQITSGPREDRAHRLFTGDEQFLVQYRDGRVTVDPDLAPLLEDVEFPALLPRNRLYTVWAWFSGPGVRTWLHYDTNGCHNLNAQLTGEKECELISPEEIRRIYPFLAGGTNPATNCSRVDVEAPDETRFPDFFEAARWRTTLQAGDLLFIPAWWSHTFRHVGELNANVNFWWKPDRPALNATAVRQAWLDVIARANVNARNDSPDAALIRKLDEAALLFAVA